MYILHTYGCVLVCGINMSGLQLWPPLNHQNSIDSLYLVFGIFRKPHWYLKIPLFTTNT